MTYAEKDMNDVVQEAIRRAMKDESNTINFIEDPNETIEVTVNNKSVLLDTHTAPPLHADEPSSSVEGTEPSTELTAVLVEEAPLKCEVENKPAVTEVKAPVKSAAPKKNAIPPPEIEISLLQINTSYKQVSALVDQLYVTVRHLFSEKPSKEELLLNAMKIVSMVVPAVENLVKTGKMLKGLEKKDLAIAVVNGLVKRVLENEDQLLTIYNIMIQPHLEDMIESVIYATRHVNNRYEQGNNGLGREQKKSKFSCICI